MGQFTGPSLPTILQYWFALLKISPASTGSATGAAAALGLVSAAGAAKAVIGRTATARTVMNFMVGIWRDSCMEINLSLDEELLDVDYGL